MLLNSDDKEGSSRQANRMLLGDFESESGLNQNACIKHEPRIFQDVLNNTRTAKKARVKNISNNLYKGS